jgi:hypothetical protein
MSPEQEKIDKFLETALRSYSEAEPRVGFEGRILANLRTEPVRVRWQLRLVYATAAMVTLVAVLYGIWQVRIAVTGGSTQPALTIAVSHAPVLDVTPTPKVAVPQSTRDKVAKQVRTRPDRTWQPGTIVGSQLPTPRPLSSQEKLLLAFARENPREVVTTIEWQEQMRRSPEPVPVEKRGEQQ